MKEEQTAMQDSLKSEAGRIITRSIQQGKENVHK